MTEIPQNIKDELLNISNECIKYGNFTYLKHRLDFVERLYSNNMTIIKGIKRWDILTVMMKDDKLIDRNFLKKKVCDLIDFKYESALESV